MKDLIDIIEKGFDARGQLSDDAATRELDDAVQAAISMLDAGTSRVAEPRDGGWHVNQWLKKAVLLSFRLSSNEMIQGQYSNFFDKVPLKYASYTDEDFRRDGVRVVPDAIVRRGAYVASDVVLMPSYVNIGAFVDSGTLVDTWATVGSCAQIGKNVHLSGGVGIGGVLEPVQAGPTIIEDNCFIGARSVIMDGVIVEHGSIIANGVSIDQNTKIYDRATEQISYGRVPAESVVVPGALPSDDGKYALYCAVIAKQVDEETRRKVSVNQLLRGI